MHLTDWWWRVCRSISSSTVQTLRTGPSRMWTAVFWFVVETVKTAVSVDAIY